MERLSKQNTSLGGCTIMSAESESTKMGIETLQAELQNIKAGQVRIENSMGQIIELTKHVALLQDRAENHRSETAAMESRFTSSIDKLDDTVGKGIEERERSIKKVHERIDGLQKWVWMVMGGGLVVGSLLVYVGESAKGLVAEVVRLHDSELLLKQRVENLEKRTKE
jgi:hypothetical protein